MISGSLWFALLIGRPGTETRRDSSCAEEGANRMSAVFALRRRAVVVMVPVVLGAAGGGGDGGSVVVMVCPNDSIFTCKYCWIYSIWTPEKRTSSSGSKNMSNIVQQCLQVASKTDITKQLLFRGPRIE